MKKTILIILGLMLCIHSAFGLTYLNDSIGIGKNPSYTLDVVGSANFTQGVNASSLCIAGKCIDEWADVNITVDTSSFVPYSGATQTVDLNNQVMTNIGSAGTYFDSYGNLFIGGSPGAIIGYNNAAGNGADLFSFDAQSNSNTYAQLKAFSDDVGSGTESSRFGFLVRNNGEGVSEKFTIKGSGKVGILTTDPASYLDVATTISDGEIAQFLSSESNANVRIKVGNADASTNIGIGATVPHPYYYSSTGNFFWGEDSNPTMFIANSNGGIGRLLLGYDLTSEDGVNRFQVNGNSNFTGDVFISGEVGATSVCVSGDCRTSWPSAGGSASVNGNAGYVAMFNGTSSVNNSLIYQNNGYVGINTTSPSHALTVVGDVNISADRFMVGTGAKANGSYSTAIGQGTTSTGLGSTAIGYATTATGSGSTALGWTTGASGESSTALGAVATASGDNSIAAGQYVSATKGNSIVLGVGVDFVDRLVNNVASSLMVGFNSTTPSLFVNKTVVMANGTGGLCIGSDCRTSWPSAGGSASVNGNAGYVAMFNGTSSVNNSAIYQNNGNIAIGTTSSGSYRLYVDGTSYFNNTLSVAQSANVQFANGQYIQDNTGGGLAIAVPGYSLDLKSGTDTTAAIKFYTNGNSESMRISKDGYVGINTTSPSHALTVVGDVNISADRFMVGTGAKATGLQGSAAIGYASTASGDGAVVLGSVSNASGVYSSALGYSVQATGNGATAIGHSTLASGMSSLAMGYATGATASNSIILGKGTDINNRLVNNVANSFMVGFGTTPSLVVNGSAVIANGTGGLCIGSDCRTSWPSAGGSASVNGNAGYVAMFNGTSSVNNSAIYQIDGNISIGTTSNGKNKLDVEGSVAIGSSYSGSSVAPVDGLVVQGDVNIGIAGVGSASKLYVFDSDSSNSVAIYASTSSASSQGIAIRGSASVAGGSDTAYAGYFTISDYDDNGNGNGYAVYANSYSGGLNYNNYGIYATASGATKNWAGYFDDGNVYIKNNVGIGATSPGENLEIEVSDTSDPAMTFDSDGNEYTIGIDSSDADKFKISDSTALGTNDRLVIEGSSGFMGIGTSSPDTVLEIYDAGGMDGVPTVNITNEYSGSAAGIGVDVYLMSGSNEAYGYRSKIDNANYGYAYYADVTNGGSSSYAFYAANGKSYFKDNIGIGATSPGENLEIEVSDTSDPAMTFDSDGNEYTIGIDSSDADKFKISDSTALGTNDRLVIEGSSGFIGIGTSSPDTVLEIYDAGGMDGVPTVNITNEYSGSAAGIGVDVYLMSGSNEAFGYRSKIDGANNGYGFYSDVTNGGSSSYAFYAANGKSYFKDNVGIGVTDPAVAKLEINGALKIADVTEPACGVSTVGMIIYNVSSNVGNFYGCRQTGASTYAWAQLN